MLRNEQSSLFNTQYIYLDDICSEARKRRKKCADLSEVGPKEVAIESS